MPGMKTGYARVSTDEQDLDLQLDAPTAAGCEQVFSDEGVSGAGNPRKRPCFAEAMAAINAGDCLTVWKLDRLGRSLRDLNAPMGEFEAHGVEFHSPSNGIDTNTAGGKLVFHIMGALAEFERSLIAERTKEGMKAAKRRGKRVGRPQALTEEQVERARSALANSGEALAGMASVLGVHRHTLKRALQSGAEV